MRKEANLTTKEQKFIDALMETGSQTAAYKVAYDTENMKDTSIHNRAYVLAKKPNVKTEITARRAELTERCMVNQVDIVMGLFKVIDDYNEAVHLAKSDNVQDQKKAKRLEMYVNGSMVVAALKTIAEMTGLSAPSPTVVNNGVVVNIIKPSIENF